MTVLVESGASIPDLPIAPRRVHLTRLLQVWRSGGWPCRDAVEIDLLAANWVSLSITDSGIETLRLTDQGLRLLAQARQSNQRVLSSHDRLAQRVALQLAQAGRIVWRELSLRAQVTPDEAPAEGVCTEPEAPLLWPDETDSGPEDRSKPHTESRRAWRVARPDVFSIRNTSVEGYLRPMVHEVKVSRADLLSDLRHAAKRESYQWLSCETCYVFPAGVAEPDEIPEAFGVWTLNGSIDEGSIERVRPARHSPCKLPFAVWMALARSTPIQFDADGAQGHLGGPGADVEAGPLPEA
jgi:hypothetical protein